MTQKKAVQREVFYQAFEMLGGIDKLIAWCNESSDNYKEFIKLYVKLVPPIKADKNDDNHESFIMMLMAEEKKRINGIDKPVKLIEVNTIDSQSHGG
jgi:hypothetical protein